MLWWIYIPEKIFYQEMSFSINHVFHLYLFHPLVTIYKSRIFLAQIILSLFFYSLHNLNNLIHNLLLGLQLEFENLLHIYKIFIATLLLLIIPKPLWNILYLQSSPINIYLQDILISSCLSLLTLNLSHIQ